LDQNFGGYFTKMILPNSKKIGMEGKIFNQKLNCYISSFLQLMTRKSKYVFAFFLFVPATEYFFKFYYCTRLIKRSIMPIKTISGIEETRGLLVRQKTHNREVLGSTSHRGDYFHAPFIWIKSWKQN
jgi:hypothetical protein